MLEQWFGWQVFCPLEKEVLRAPGSATVESPSPLDGGGTLALGEVMHVTGTPENNQQRNEVMGLRSQTWRTGAHFCSGRLSLKLNV